MLRRSVILINFSDPLQLHAEGYSARRWHIVEFDNKRGLFTVDIRYGTGAEDRMAHPVAHRKADAAGIMLL